MKFLSSALLALGAVAGTVAQADANATAFADGLLNALRQNNLTLLADIVGNNSAALVPALMSPGNKTVLAPNNQAIQALGNVGNQELVATIAYHVLNGTYKDADMKANEKTIATSMLNMSEYVILPNHRAQVVVLGKHGNNNTNYVQQAGSNVSFSVAKDGPIYQSLLVQPIEMVLRVPGKTSAVASQLGATQLASLLGQAGLVDALDDSIVTVFAPTDDAIKMAAGPVGSATDDQKRAVLLNHVVNGTVVYSTALSKTPSAISASGNELKFTTNSTGAYVSSGNVTAKIIQSDYVAKNGVVHVIDAVLLNTTKNEQAAGSAYSSATAAAATQTAAPGVNHGSGDHNGARLGSTVAAGLVSVAALASGVYFVVV